jgi:citrate lyase subunit beta/citryl-CoA lyase
MTRIDPSSGAGDRLAAARSFLFVPSHTPERFEKAIRAGADAVILDLEDGVPLGEKAFAREALARRWGAPSTDGAAFARARQRTRVKGLLRRHRRAPEPGRPGSGDGAEGKLAHLDFTADTGIVSDAGEAELMPLRFAMTTASRIANLPPPVDGVTVQLDDEQRLRDDTMRSRHMGFGAKLCIHPRQVGPVHEAFQPGADEIAWARCVVQADADSGGGAVQLDGRMIDRPVVLGARRTLARAELYEDNTG